ncbi:MAG: dihydroneopterin aldolase [Puia sp.]|nr:dihydroneopterin aldolase [Puia sp.]
MVTVQLHNLIFSGRHGVFQEEQLTGNTFEVDLDVMYDDRDHPFDNLASTINYVELYQIVQQRMQEKVPLLEKICEGIIQKISSRYPFVYQISVSVFKLQAPIGNFQGKAGVTMTKKFEL